MRTVRHTWAAAILFLVTSGGLSAQGGDDSRVAKLEETVRALESRIAALEKQLQTRKGLNKAPKGKANWRQLEKGMTQDEVEQLLGSPTKVDVYGSFTVWRYGDAAGGTVHFDDDTRTVQSWHEP